MISLTPKGVVSPLKLSTWEGQYLKLPAFLQRRYAVILDGIKNGFKIGVADSHRFTRSTIIEPKERYDAETRSAIFEYLDGEKEAGRIAGPLSKEDVERQVGFFQTSPFKLVDKSGSSKKRFVRDFSAPHGSDARASVNELIRQGTADTPPYRTTWHVFPHVARLVLALPPTARVHVADVKSAFRIVPIHPSSQPYLVMQIDDSFYIDRTLAMGLTTATDIFGGVMDLFREGVRIDWVDQQADAFNWVDDVGIVLAKPLPPLRSSSAMPSTSISTATTASAGGAGASRWADSNEQIEARYARFGLPLAPDKIKPIVDDQPTFDYLGFCWNIEAKTVTLLESKRTKFLDRLRALDSPTLNLSLGEVESLAGSLAHLANIIRGGKFRLRALFAFAASFGGNHSVRRHPSQRLVRARGDDRYAGVAGEMRWWRELLERGPISGQLVERRPDAEVEILSDACDTGIGILVDGAACYWPLKLGWKGVGGLNIDFGEALGVELALLAALQLRGAEVLRGRNIVAFCDNGSVVDGWAARSHANLAVARILMRLVALEFELEASIELLYIPSADNDADAISRGDLSGASGAVTVLLTERWETRSSLDLILA